MRGRAVNVHRPLGRMLWVNQYRALLHERGEGEAGKVVLLANLPYVRAHRQVTLMQYDLPASPALAVCIVQLRNNLRNGVPGVVPFPALPGGDGTVFVW